MEDNERRDCSCGDNNMVMGSHQVDRKDCEREEMLMKIRELNFAVIELGLYLNTHPEDQRALCLHRKYTRELKDLMDKYQKVYGPLSIYFPCNKWRWLEEPWASFKLGVNYLSTKSVQLGVFFTPPGLDIKKLEKCWHNWTFENLFPII